MSVKKTSNMALADFPFLGRFVDGAKCSTIHANGNEIAQKHFLSLYCYLGNKWYIVARFASELLSK